MSSHRPSLYDALFDASSVPPGTPMPAVGLPTRQHEIVDATAQLAPAITTAARRTLPGIKLDLRQAARVERSDNLFALWKAHRVKFSLDGDVGRSLRADRVLEQLHADHQLAVAGVAVGKRTFLLWVDLDEQLVFAAFEGMHAWLSPRFFR